MNKVLKLNVQFWGNYGGDVDETVLLPLDINGVLFETLKEEVNLPNAVYLGEIEGKHSECYGDLSIEVINLDELNIKDVAELINKSDFNEFEGFFEMAEYDFEEENEEFDQEKVNKLLDSYGIDRDTWGVKTGEVYIRFVEELKKKYVENFKSITVLEKDYEAAIILLKNNSVELFN